MARNGVPESHFFSSRIGEVSSRCQVLITGSLFSLRGLAFTLAHRTLEVMWYSIQNSGVRIRDSRLGITPLSLKHNVDVSSLRVVFVSPLLCTV